MAAREGGIARVSTRRLETVAMPPSRDAIRNLRGQSGTERRGKTPATSRQRLSRRRALHVPSPRGATKRKTKQNSTAISPRLRNGPEARGGGAQEKPVGLL